MSVPPNLDRLVARAPVPPRSFAMAWLGGLWLAVGSWVGIACGPAPPTTGESPAGVSDTAPANASANAASTSSDLELWSDTWMLGQSGRYLDDRRFRRTILERSLTSHDNLYARARLTAYGLDSGGWDALPTWVPRAQPVDDEVVQDLIAGRAPVLHDAVPLWDGGRPQDMAGWVALGRRVFFEYPLRPEVFAEHALAHPAIAQQVGLARADDGTWPGVVAFADLDGRARVGITCALCHVEVVDGAVTIGRARRELDYGGMRLAYHRDTGAPLPASLAARMAEWGRGRADITQDDDEDPVAIPDLWSVKDHRYLTQAATLRHVHPAALAIRQETQILHANRERTRPPRELAWALAMYVYSLQPPSREPVASPRVEAGAKIFARECAGCHSEPTGAGAPVSADRIGTEPTLALGRARGTGLYRPAPLVAVAAAAPYLHHGVVPTLEDLLGTERLQPDYTRGAHGAGPALGHRYGTELPTDARAALIAYLRTR